MLTATKPTLIEWIADVNNLLFANGSLKFIEHDDVDAEMEFRMGYSSRQVASRILGKPLPSNTPSQAWNIVELLNLYGL